MTLLTIRAETPSTYHTNEVLSELVRLSTSLNVCVATTINGLNINVYPQMTVADVERELKFASYPQD